MAILARRLAEKPTLGDAGVTHLLYYVADTHAERPATDLNAGDQCFVVATGILWVAQNATTWAQASGEAAGEVGSAPTGSGMVWFTNTPPTGYLLCDGASLLRSEYAALFAVIGTQYGAADADHFNVPNMKGRVPVGLDAAQTEFDALGETGGAKTHQLTTPEIPAHTHVQDAHTHVQDAHTHVQNAHTHVQDSHNHTQDAHQHVLTSQTATTGGATSYEHGALDTSSAEAEATEVTNLTTATNQAATAVNQNATAVNQNATAVNQNATAVNQNTGGGGAHNNLQPYLTLNFIIKT